MVTFSAACSTDFTKAKSPHVVQAAVRLLYLTSEQDNGLGPDRFAQM